MRASWSAVVAARCTSTQRSGAIGVTAAIFSQISSTSGRQRVTRVFTRRPSAAARVACRAYSSRELALSTNPAQPVYGWLACRMRATSGSPP